MRQIGKREERLTSKTILILSVMVLSILGMNMDGRADELISCRYQQAEGKTIVLRLDIGSPAPAMLILVQKIPPGVLIKNAEPPIKKYDHKKGEARWLIKQLQSGTITFTINLDQDIDADKISGEIRYKDPVAGAMKIMAIKP